MLNRIILHWTAGNWMPNKTDKEHYHYLYARPLPYEATVIEGNYAPEDNIDCRDGKYAAHTGGLNTGSIGVAVCGMYDFVNKKSIGDRPITIHQIEKMCSHVASLCHKYKISTDIVRTHYEVGKLVTRGAMPVNELTKKNIGKKDISFIPYLPDMNPDNVGDFLRDKIKWYYWRLI